MPQVSAGAGSTPIKRRGARRQAGAKVFERQLETLAESDLWLPAEQRSCLGNVGAALHRIVYRQGR